MTINSRQKGKVGELELASVLRVHGIGARRGQQFSGGGDSPDVVTDLPDVHFEVKRVEAGNLYTWMEQAKRDAAEGKIPVVAHRRNRQEWVAILPLVSFLELYNRATSHE
jgi:Holliday junction resolvase